MLKKIAIGFVILLIAYGGLVAFLLWNADSFIGPAHPERDGRAFLQSKNYPAATIDKVVALKHLDAATFEKISKETSTDVRFLIGQNPHISPALLSQLVQDPSDFVRGGAALNPHLTPLQIQQLSDDPSHTTQIYIARNPQVPVADLVRLHEEHGIDLVWFAMNPKCPQILQDKIRATNDEEALYWLEATEQKREQQKEETTGKT